MFSPLINCSPVNISHTIPPLTIHPPFPTPRSAVPSVPTVHFAQSRCCGLKTPSETFTAFRKSINTYISVP
jgi:hypothetical protein